MLIEYMQISLKNFFSI